MAWDMQQGSHLPFKDEQTLALGLWPRLSSTSPSLAQAVALYAIPGFSQDSQSGGFLENKTLNSVFLSTAYFSLLNL